MSANLSTWLAALRPLATDFREAAERFRQLYLWHRAGGTAEQAELLARIRKSYWRDEASWAADLNRIPSTASGQEKAVALILGPRDGVIRFKQLAGRAGAHLPFGDLALSPDLHAVAWVGFVLGVLRRNQCNLWIPPDPRDKRPFGELAEDPFTASATAIHLAESEILPAAAAAQPPTTDNRVPRWDDEAATLWWGGAVARQFKSAARNQRDLVEAFHRREWARTIDDPFNNSRTLNKTVTDLNNSLAAGTIRFRQDGTGERVCWCPAE